jgi:4-hydroxyphenylacetate 3-monooxygenase
MGTAVRPLTGAEYLESLRDDREVWIYGERVGDVTEHPAFRNPARMIARLYDSLHDERAQALTTETDTGNGGFTHRFYRIPHSAEELVAARDAIVEWARMTYGWMSRTPDYKASFQLSLGANPNYWRGLVPEDPGALPLSEPRWHQPTRRPASAARRGGRCVRPRRGGAR